MLSVLSSDNSVFEKAMQLSIHDQHDALSENKIKKGIQISFYIFCVLYFVDY